MKMNNNSTVAIVLIAFGALLLLGKIGFGLGWLMHWLVPLAMIFLGYLGIKNGRPLIGGIVLVIGLLSLVGKLFGLFAFFFPVILIVVGLSMLGRRSGAH